MSQYSVRIELHGAVEADYNTLHKAMWNAGFRRVVKSDSDKLYLLPTGSYIKTTEDTLETTYKSARDAANSTKKSFWIWMVQRSNAMFALKEVQKDPDAPLRRLSE